jgi:beta-lactamase class C
MGRKGNPDGGSEPPSQIDQAVHKFLKVTGTPGVAVVLFDAGKDNIYCWGDARTDPSPVKVTPDTVFGIGSVTKTFTSTLLACQVAAPGGAFKLNDPVVSHLPPAVKKQHKDIEKVTLVMLATHTAGFPGGGPTGDDLFRDNPPSAELLKWWQDWTNESKHPIGSHYAYSNVGMITLGYAVAGNNYYNLLNGELCGPLGMTHTAPAKFLPANAKLVQGHLDKGGETVAIQTQNTDLNSSPQDMLLYLKAQLGVTRPPRALAQALDLSHQVHFRNQGQPFNMGLGWEISKGATKVYTKNGGTTKGGTGCWIGFAPDKQFGLVVMGNKFGTGKSAGESIASFGSSLFQQLTGISSGGDTQA